MKAISEVPEAPPQRRNLPASRGGTIKIENVTISFGSGRRINQAVSETNLIIEPGEFVCILGPSGCGKSTLLNAIAGYVRPSSGTITVDDKEVEGPGPDRGMVFQQYSLFPWKTIEENIGFGPMIAGNSWNQCESIARTFLAMMGLTRFAKSYPSELSGGMQQRVGIARALANYPKVLLMDEPFGALDAQTRLIMQENLLKIWGEFGITVVFITHDVDEAIFLADRVLLMSASPGSIIKNIDVRLSRPRIPEISTTHDFIRMKRECLDQIRKESMKVFDA